MDVFPDRDFSQALVRTEYISLRGGIWLIKYSRMGISYECTLMNHWRSETKTAISSGCAKLYSLGLVLSEESDELLD